MSQVVNNFRRPFAHCCLAPPSMCGCDNPDHGVAVYQNTPLTEVEKTALLRDALQNFMGMFDSPIGRRQHGTDSFYLEAIRMGREAMEATA